MPSSSSSHLLSPPAKAMASAAAAANGPGHVAGEWYSVPDLALRDHHFAVPLNYSAAAGRTIRVFAREVVAAGKEDDPTMPYLLFLQGGPGFESPRPLDASGWMKKAAEDFRIVLLDQRGTGLSTPLTPSSMAQFASAGDLAGFLSHFRADSIVRDAELIRHRLGAGPWTVLGQSFGGFCAVTYLSFAPQGLKSVLLTGGLPPIGPRCTADAVYRACFEQVLQQNHKYYKRFPQDVALVHDIVRQLELSGGAVALPSGGVLSTKGLQCLGLVGLGSGSGFERLHYLLERAWDPVLVPGAERRISYSFLKSFETWLEFDANPLYALLHESIYCQGAPSRWSAQRIRKEYEALFDPIKATEEGRPVYFTGEMVFPWMFEEISALRPFKEAAHILAMKEDWPPLYDASRLNGNQVPVAAAVYFEDMYVNFNIAMETASAIHGIRLWVTNEFMHSGLRDSGSQVFEQLMGILQGRKPCF